jgi:hypothetical protein
MGPLRLAPTFAIAVLVTVVANAPARAEIEDTSKAPHIEWTRDCRPIISFVDRERFMDGPTLRDTLDPSKIDLNEKGGRHDALWLLGRFSIRPDRRLLRRYLGAELRRFDAALEEPRDWPCNKRPFTAFVGVDGIGDVTIDVCEAEAEHLLEDMNDFAGIAITYADVLRANPDWPETVSLRRRWLGLEESATNYFKARLALEEKAGGAFGSHVYRLERFYRSWIALGVELGAATADIETVGAHWRLYLGVEDGPTEFWPFGSDERDNPKDGSRKSNAARMRILGNALAKEWTLLSFDPDHDRANRFISTVTRWEGDGAPWGDAQACGYDRPFEALVTMQAYRVAAAKNPREVERLFAEGRARSVVEQLQESILDQRILLRRDVWRTAAHALAQAEAKLNANRPQWRDETGEVATNARHLCRAAEAYEMGPDFGCPSRALH